jgi:hypothetical protein
MQFGHWLLLPARQIGDRAFQNSAARKLNTSSIGLIGPRSSRSICFWLRLSTKGELLFLAGGGRKCLPILRCFHILKVIAPCSAMSAFCLLYSNRYRDRRVKGLPVSSTRPFSSPTAMAACFHVSSIAASSNRIRMSSSVIVCTLHLCSAMNFSSGLQARMGLGQSIEHSSNLLSFRAARHFLRKLKAISEKAGVRRRRASPIPQDLRRHTA